VRCPKKKGKTGWNMSVKRIDCTKEVEDDPEMKELVSKYTQIVEMKKIGINWNC